MLADSDSGDCNEAQVGLRRPRPASHPDLLAFKSLSCCLELEHVPPLLKPGPSNQLWLQARNEDQEQAPATSNPQGEQPAAEQMMYMAMPGMPYAMPVRQGPINKGLMDSLSVDLVPDHGLYAPHCRIIADSFPTRGCLSSSQTALSPMQMVMDPAYRQQMMATSAPSAAAASAPSPSPQQEAADKGRASVRRVRPQPVLVFSPEVEAGTLPFFS
jgi:hypothetical protein